MTVMGQTSNDVGILAWKLFRGLPLGRPGMRWYAYTFSLLGWEVNEASSDHAQ